jgi:preprotein translocase subunit SecE
MANKLTSFFGEVKTEMKKVSWSTRKELLSSTWIVIVSVFLLTLFIGIADFAISRIVNLVIR